MSGEALSPSNSFAQENQIGQDKFSFEQYRQRDASISSSASSGTPEKPKAVPPIIKAERQIGSYSTQEADSARLQAATRAASQSAQSLQASIQSHQHPVDVSNSIQSIQSATRQMALNARIISGGEVSHQSGGAFSPQSANGMISGTFENRIGGTSDIANVKASSSPQTVTQTTQDYNTTHGKTTTTTTTTTTTYEGARGSDAAGVRDVTGGTHYQEATRLVGGTGRDGVVYAASRAVEQLMGEQRAAEQRVLEQIALEQNMKNQMIAQGSAQGGQMITQTLTQGFTEQNAQNTRVVDKMTCEQITGVCDTVVQTGGEIRRVIGHEYGPERVVSVTERVDESRSHVISERFVEHTIKIPKRVITEEIIERVIIVPEKIITEDVIEEGKVVKEKIIEYASPTIVDKVVEVPEIEYIEKIIEVPERVVQVKIKEVEKVEIQERIVEVPKIIPRERVVEVPEIQYRDVPVEKIVEIPEYREEVIVREVPVPQYVEVSTPNQLVVEVPVDVERIVPVTVEAEVTVGLSIPQFNSKLRSIKYPVVLPRFLEVPVAAEFFDAQMLNEVQTAHARLSHFVTGRAAICDLEQFSTGVAKISSDFFSNQSLCTQRMVATLSGNTDTGKGIPSQSTLLTGQASAPGLGVSTTSYPPYANAATSGTIYSSSVAASNLAPPINVTSALIAQPSNAASIPMYGSAPLTAATAAPYVLATMAPNQSLANSYATTATSYSSYVVPQALSTGNGPTHSSLPAYFGDTTMVYDVGQGSAMGPGGQPSFIAQAHVQPVAGYSGAYPADLVQKASKQVTTDGAKLATVFEQSGGYAVPAPGAASKAMMTSIGGGQSYFTGSTTASTARQYGTGDYLLSQGSEQAGAQHMTAGDRIQSAAVSALSSAYSTGQPMSSNQAMAYYTQGSTEAAKTYGQFAPAMYSHVPSTTGSIVPPSIDQSITTSLLPHSTVPSSTALSNFTSTSAATGPGVSAQRTVGVTTAEESRYLNGESSVVNSSQMDGYTSPGLYSASYRPQCDINGSQKQSAEGAYSSSLYVSGVTASSADQLASGNFGTNRGGSAYETEASGMATGMPASSDVHNTFRVPAAQATRGWDVCGRA